MAPDTADSAEEPSFEVERKAWEMAEAADAEVERVTVEELQRDLERSEENGEDLVVLDVRDIREAWIEGSIPGAKHAPRGMIEWWADPSTEYYKPFFHPDRRYVVYCNEAGRSALVAKVLGEMGYDDVAHLEGGFTAWQETGAEVEDVPQRDYE